MPLRKRRINKDLLLIGIPSLALVIGAFALTLILMRPAPPSEIVMSTGPADGTYHAIAQKYRDILERNGVTLRLQPSAGSLQNFRRLTDASNPVDVAIVQGGVAGGEGLSDVVSLGSLYYEPLWVFYRAPKPVTRLAALRGKMIAVGPADSGTALLAMTLLNSSGIAQPPTTVLKIGGRAAANLLMSGGIDAALFMGDAQSSVIQELVHADGVRLMSLEHAEAYAAQHRFLTENLYMFRQHIDLVRQRAQARKQRAPSSVATTAGSVPE